MVERPSMNFSDPKNKDNIDARTNKISNNTWVMNDF